MCKNEKTHLTFLFFNIYLTHGNVGEFFKKVVSVLYYSDFIKGNRVRFIAIILLIIGGSALDSLRKGNLLLFVSIIGINVVVDSIGSSLSYRANYLYDKQTQEYFHKLRFAEVEKIYSSGNKAPKVSSVQNSLTQDLNMLGENFLAPWLKIAACGLDVVLSSIIVFTYSWLLQLAFIAGNSGPCSLDVFHVTIFISSFAKGYG